MQLNISSNKFEYYEIEELVKYLGKKNKVMSMIILDKSLKSNYKNI